MAESATVPSMIPIGSHGMVLASGVAVVEGDVVAMAGEVMADAGCVFDGEGDAVWHSGAVPGSIFILGAFVGKPFAMSGLQPR